MPDTKTIADWVDAKSQGSEYGYYALVSPLLKPRTRTVRIDRAPPRRMLAPLRWRAFKTSADRGIWGACWEPVRRLLEDGWRMQRVTVDWGAALPMTTAWREETIRELTGCYDACEVRETAGDTGRGSVIVDLVHD